MTILTSISCFNPYSLAAERKKKKERGKRESSPLFLDLLDYLSRVGVLQILPQKLTVLTDSTGWLEKLFQNLLQEIDPYNGAQLYLILIMKGTTQLVHFLDGSRLSKADKPNILADCPYFTQHKISWPIYTSHTYFHDYQIKRP